MALTRIKDGESFESAFRRFKKSCEKAGILSEVKKREHYEKPSVRLKKKSISARKRATKKVRTRGGFGESGGRGDREGGGTGGRGDREGGGGGRDGGGARESSY